jgi:hypothetical protein
VKLKGKGEESTSTAALTTATKSIPAEELIKIILCFLRCVRGLGS